MEDITSPEEGLGAPVSCTDPVEYFEKDGVTFNAVDCFPPAPPATDEGLNEAETGVIVLLSLIAVAAVAGAVAVYRAST